MRIRPGLLGVACVSAAAALWLAGCGAAPEPAAPELDTGASGWTISATSVGLAPSGLTCADLPAYVGPATLLAGTTITAQLITSQLDLSAGDITIERSCIQPASVAKGTAVLTTTNSRNEPAAGPVTIRDSEISGVRLATTEAAWATGFVGIGNLTGNYVHHLGSGIALMNTGTSLNAVIARNYVTDLVAAGDPATTGNHSDAFTVRDFSAADNPDRQAVVRNNRFDCDSRNATGALFVQAWAGPIDNLTIDGNLLEGGGYQLALEANANGYTNVRASNNRFSGTGWGAAYRTGGPGWAAWHDNYLYDAEADQARGKPVNEP